MDFLQFFLCFIFTGGLIGFFITYLLYIKLIRKRSSRPTRAEVEQAHFRQLRQLEEIHALDPIAFEHFVGDLFQRMGYQVETTVASGDEGIDLFVQRQGKHAVVQCKRYKGTVGQPVVRDLYGVMLHNQADEAYLVTTGTISLPAQQWAADKRIQLVDGATLIEWIEAFPDSAEEEELKQKPSLLNQPRILITVGTFAISILAFICGCIGLLLLDPLDNQQSAATLPTLTPTFTITPTPTTTPMPTATIAPISTNPSPTPTWIPEPEPTEPLPTPEPIEPPAKPVVTTTEDNINLRSGPGTDYEIIGTLSPGQSLEIVGRNADSSWWQVSTPNGFAWAAASVVTANNIDDSIAIVEASAPIEPPTSTEIPLEVLLYGLEIGEKSQTLAEVLISLGQLMLDPQFGNDEWTLQVAAQIAIIRLTHEELLALDVPPQMAEVHVAVLDATGDCYLAMDYLISGLDNLSMNDLEEASRLLTQCGQKIDMPGQMIEEYMAGAEGAPAEVTIPPALPPAPAEPAFTDETVDPSWWPCAQGQIKGNRDSMIYHTPTGAFYAKTYEGVECFNTPTEAETAGYRASKR